MLAKELFHTILTTKLNVPDAQLTQWDTDAQARHRDLEPFVFDKKLVDEGAVYQAAAEALNVPFVSLKDKAIPKETLQLVPAPVAQAHAVVAFDTDEQTVSLAMLDPSDIQTIEFLRRKIGRAPKVFLAPPSDIQSALKAMHHDDIEEDTTITKYIQDAQKAPANTPEALRKAAEDAPIIHIVTNIIEHAIYEDASDIHIEPTETGVDVRYRIDGILSRVMTLPGHVHDGILARIKVLSNLQIDEHMIPQDGRFKLTVGAEPYAFRVSIMPLYHGEKAVIRILRENQRLLHLDDLGFLPGMKKLVQNAIDKPHGMILVTGPTGSGKTTTLYTLLNILNKPKVNICTIEDPIEYQMPGINQSQVNPKVGFTFATGLRALLRQDPDIIMVGEIRDQETAEIAIHAAMTGHLVLSTLHTNDAPTTLPRITEMGIPPFLTAFTVNIIIAQRLVRMLNPKEAEPYQLGKEELEQLSAMIGSDDLLTLFQKHGLLKNGSDAKASSVEQLTFYRPKQAQEGGGPPYKGRIGIFEVLPVDETLSHLISQNAHADAIKEHAKKAGMLTLFEDGLLKAKQGLTSIEEVLRATKE